MVTQRHAIISSGGRFANRDDSEGGAAQARGGGISRPLHVATAHALAQAPQRGCTFTSMCRMCSRRGMQGRASGMLPACNTRSSGVTPCATCSPGWYSARKGLNTPPAALL